MGAMAFAPVGEGKLGRDSSHRRALLRHLVTALFARERIETTLAKGRQVRAVAERLITTAKKGDLHARRLVASYVLDPDVAKKLCEQIAPRYAERPGGYTRIVKLGPRRGDAAPRAIVELV